jgi:hypothetical protein
MMLILKRWPLVPALLLLLPQLAYADALGAVGLGNALADILALLAVPILGLIMLAYRRASPAMMLVLMGFSFFFGLFPTREWMLFQINPYIYICLPLGIWLLGAIKARLAAREDWQLLWLGIAIIGLRQLLELGLERYFNQLYAGSQEHLQLLRVGLYTSKVLAGLGAWWVVLRQLHLVGNGTWWQPWWRAPAMVAAVGAAYQGVTVLIEGQTFEMADFSVSWSWIGWLALESGIVGFVAGALALRVIPPPAAPPASDKFE